MSETPRMWRGPSSFIVECLVDIPGGCGDPFPYFNRIIETLKPWAVLHVRNIRIEGSLHEARNDCIYMRQTLQEFAGEESFKAMVAKALEPLSKKAAKEFAPDIVYAQMSRIVDDLHSEIRLLAVAIERITNKIARPETAEDEGLDDA